MSADHPALAVLGHIEWVQFAHVAHVPGPGDVAHADDVFDEPAGGGAVAAVALARLAGAAALFTALGADDQAARSCERLAALGVTVHAATRDAPTRRAVTLLDDAGERTITTFGERLAPSGGDALPWERLDGLDGVYLTASDGEAAARARAAARVLVASPRAGEALAGLQLDALVYSAGDAVERAWVERVQPSARLVVLTEGAHGGRWQDTRDGRSGRFEAVAPPGPLVDTYGSGDSFAAGLTYGLSVGMGPDEALALAARCGAACVSGRGPYGRQLTRAEL